MSNKLDSKKVKPHNNKVLISIDKIENKHTEVVTEQSIASRVNTEVYEGTVKALGETALNTENGCPGLKEGDKIIINQFAGSAIATENEYCKVVNAYDIVAFGKSVDELQPSCDRIMVEVLDENLVEVEGVKYEKSYDARERETQKGRVISCGVNARQFPKGTIVFFDPYCGLMILNTLDRKLKTVNSFDIEFSYPE